MPITFRDAALVQAGGNAAFVRVTDGARADDQLGAILQINARGEPVEFVYNSMRVPTGALWKQDDLPQYVNRTLLSTLMHASQRSPLLICCLAEEIDASTFREDLEVQIPVCRIGRIGSTDMPSEWETREQLTSFDRVFYLYWSDRPPGAEAPARKLLDTLARRGLLFEPFERALAGLHEALPDGVSNEAGAADSVSG